MSVSRIPAPILVLFDALSFFLALAAVLFVRYGTSIDENVLAEHAVAFGFIFAVWMAVFGIAGLYGAYVFADPKSWWQTCLGAFTVNAAVAVAVFYLLPFWSISPKTNLALILVVSLVFIFGWRYILWKIWQGSFRKVRAIIVGSKEECAELLGELTHSPAAAFLPVLVLVVEEAEETIITKLSELIKNEHIDVVLSGEGVRKYPAVLGVVSGSLASGTAVIPIQEITENLSQKVSVRGLDAGRVIDYFSGPHHRFTDFLKRAFDVTLALAVGFAVIPFVPLIALVIKIDDGGKIFYEQYRVGRGVRVFLLRKFRTMSDEQEGSSLVSWTKDFNAWVTRIGRILRATHLDEIPQLWNIIRGDMSFVGPRPERVKLVAILEREVPFYHLRHVVRPGLTGWAQIKYHYASSVEESIEKLEYDLYYIKYRSLFLDLFILARTFKLLLGWGAR